MAELPLPQRVARTIGERQDCLFTGMHLALKGWLGRKWSILVLVDRRPWMRTLGAGAGKPWVLSHTHVSCGDTWRWGCLACALGQTRAHGCRPWWDPRLMGPMSRPSSLRSPSGPKAQESYIKTQFSWVLQQDPVLLGLHQDSRLLSFRFLNINIFLINIFFIIVESINIKHIIICVLNIISSIIIKLIIFIPKIILFFLLILWIIIKIIIFRTQIILFLILIL
jgi:hypothetical protein